MSNKERVKKIALIMIEESGLINLSMRDLCKHADIPVGSFAHIMGCTFSDFIRTLNKDTKQYTVNKSRTDPLLRKDQILNIAVDLSKKVGYHNVTRQDIAGGAGVSMGLVTNYFGTMKKLKRTVMRFAVNQGILEIIAQGLANNDPHAKKAPDELKAKAVASIAI